MTHNFATKNPSSPIFSDFAKICERLSSISHSPEAETRHILNELNRLKNLNSGTGFEPDIWLEDVLKKRCQKMPLQYIFRGWWFRQIYLYVDERVLIPRPETEITCQVALDALSSFKDNIAQGDNRHSVSRGGEPRGSAPRGAPRRLKALDLGCGSGAIGLSLAMEFKNVDVVCSDVCEDALDVARMNYEEIKPKLANNGVTIIHSRWFQQLEALKDFDIIVSNPPYLCNSEKLPDEVARYEPDIALISGQSGFEAIAEIVYKGWDFLSRDGYLIVEISPSQVKPALELARKVGYKNIKIHQDLTKRDRVLECQK